MGKKRIENVFNKVMESNGTRTMAEIMREEKYSENTVNIPSAVTKTKTWQELLEKYLPEDRVSKTHSELLKSAIVENFNVDTTLDDKAIKKIIKAMPGAKLVHIQRPDDAKNKTKVYFTIPNDKTRKDAVDMAYKLTGKYAPEKHEITDPYRKLSDQDLDERLRELEQMKGK